MAWGHQATSHYLSQCWPRFLSPYGVTRPQWVKNLSDIIWYHRAGSTLGQVLACYMMAPSHYLAWLCHAWTEEKLKSHETCSGGHNPTIVIKFQASDVDNCFTKYTWTPKILLTIKHYNHRSQNMGKWNVRQVKIVLIQPQWTRLWSMIMPMNVPNMNQLRGILWPAEH